VSEQTVAADVRTVLMTADPLGGVFTCALELSRGLEPHGVTVHLATMGAPLSAAQRDELRACPNVTLHESTFKLEWMDDPWVEVDRAGEWLLALESELHPDVIHLNGYAHAALPWRSRPLVAGHSCLLSWWEAVRGEPAPEALGPYRARVSAGLKHAAMVIAPTRATLAELERHHGPLSRAKVICNGRAAARFPPREKLSLILAVGRLRDRAKNLAQLDAVSSDIRWPVVVAGEGGPSEDHHDRPLGVTALGQLVTEDLARWMGGASLYALPARYEPFGLAPLEAALAGCALVLGDIPSLRELWGGRALFVPPDDGRALAAALNQLIDNPVQRHRLALRARSHALTFSVETMAAQYLHVYGVLSSRRRNPRSAATQRRDART
jgi:glycosyltransferase involved in cell wall biosynthesis